MDTPSFVTAPLRYARICGWLYLVVISAGIFGLFVTSKLVVHGDAVATADHIMACESLWRFGFVGALLASVCYVPVTFLLYVLLKPAGPNLSLLAAFFSLVGCAIGGAGTLGQFAPLLMLGGANYLKTFDSHQLQMQALLFLRFSGNATSISLVYFGVYCSIIGYVIIKSGYFPKFLGVLLIVGGLCYLVDSFVGFLAPALDAKIGLITIASGVAELALCLWLILIGLDTSKWNEKST